MDKITFNQTESLANYFYYLLSKAVDPARTESNCLPEADLVKFKLAITGARLTLSELFNNCIKTVTNPGLLETLKFNYELLCNFWITQQYI